VSAALITTCFREARRLDAFLDAVLAQTRQPDAIIIVDAGSDDGTPERIQARIEAGAPVRLIVEPGASRSVGRNRAIREAAAEVIAVTDVGALPRPDWFARIVAPVEGGDAEVVSGYYETNPRTLWEAAVAAATVPGPQEVDPESFLPSARSVAFRRSAWEQAGGYPEWARHNEDTPFGLALKAAGARLRFEPGAVVLCGPRAPSAAVRAVLRLCPGRCAGPHLVPPLPEGLPDGGAELMLIIGGALWPPAFTGLAALWLAYWARHAARARRRSGFPVRGTARSAGERNC